MFSNFLSEYRAVYVIMWKSMVGSDRPQINYNMARAHYMLHG